MPKKQQQWQAGDVFLVEQSDGLASVGQVLDLMMVNVPSCAFFDIRFPPDKIPKQVSLPFDKLIAAVSTTREQLDRAVWKVFARQDLALERQFWPNEPLRHSGWVGANIFGAGIVRRFLDAFYGLAPWDYYKDPNYFDQLLFTRQKKPKHLVFK